MQLKSTISFSLLKTNRQKHIATRTTSIKKKKDLQTGSDHREFQAQAHRRWPRSRPTTARSSTASRCLCNQNHPSIVKPSAPRQNAIQTCSIGEKEVTKIHSLILVALVVEHGEGDDEEDEDGIGDVDGEPELLHGEGEGACTVIDGVPAGLAVGDVGG